MSVHDFGYRETTPSRITQRIELERESSCRMGLLAFACLACLAVLVGLAVCAALSIHP